MKKVLLSFSVLALTMCLSSCVKGGTTSTNKTSQSEIKTPSYQRVNLDGTEDANGNYILFGSYPQNKVTDESVLTTLNSKVSETKPTSDNAQGFTSYKYYIGDGSIGSESNEVDYMWYKDIDTDNDGSFDYRCVYFDQYRSYYTKLYSSMECTFQDQNGYYTGEYYYFKYESIKWKILNEDNGKATLFADLLLDSQDYNYTLNSQTVNGETIYANNYEYSSIRKWLNNTFYNTAFNNSQKSIIDQVEVDNSASTTNDASNQYACSNTIDNVWLLSYQELTNSDYGFNSDADRQKKATDYAQSQGTYVEDQGASIGFSMGWYRSPDVESNEYSLLTYVDGAFKKSSVDDNSNGIAPALEIIL